MIIKEIKQAIIQLLEIRNGNYKIETKEQNDEVILHILIEEKNYNFQIHIKNEKVYLLEMKRLNDHKLKEQIVALMYKTHTKGASE